MRQDSSTASRDKVPWNMMDVWLKQNPMLYLVVVLILGGNGLGFMSTTGLRDDVRSLSRQLEEALHRLDAQERADEQFRRELDQVYRRVSYLETRTRDLEIMRDGGRFAPPLEPPNVGP